MQFKNKGYQIKRANKCAVCGSEDCDELTKHHIIGSCYSNKLGDELRKQLREIHWYYFEWDYCCLCDECHLKYESDFSDLLHKLIWEKYEIDLSETSYRSLKRYREGKQKPSELVMKKIEIPDDYLKLREFCIKFFVDKMKPKYSLV